MNFINMGDCIEHTFIFSVQFHCKMQLVLQTTEHFFLQWFYRFHIDVSTTIHFISKKNIIITLQYLLYIFLGERYWLSEFHSVTQCFVAVRTLEVISPLIYMFLRKISKQLYNLYYTPRKSDILYCKQSWAKSKQKFLCPSTSTAILGLKVLQVYVLRSSPKYFKAICTKYFLLMLPKILVNTKNSSFLILSSSANMT